MELQCRGSATGHQENGTTSNQESGPPDRKPKILGGEANTDVAIPLIQATKTREGDNYWIGHDEYKKYNVRPPTCSGEAPSRIEKDSIDVIDYQTNNTSIDMAKYHANDTNNSLIEIVYELINLTDSNSGNHRKTTSDNDSEEGNESISPPTSYSAGTHTSRG